VNELRIFLPIAPVLVYVAVALEVRAQAMGLRTTAADLRTSPVPTVGEGGM
jgi:hypothetical protein